MFYILEVLAMIQHYFNTHDFSRNNHLLSSIQYKEQLGKYLIEISTGGYIKFDQALTNFSHSHNYYEICIVISGQGTFKHGDDTYNLKEGMLFLANKNIVHEIASFETKDLYIIFFNFNFTQLKDPNDSNEEKIINKFLENHIIILEDVYELFYYFPLLNRSQNNHQEFNYIRNMLLKTLILEYITRLTYPGTITSSGKLINNSITLQAESYIDNNLNQKLSVNEIASYCHVSERNLRRLIKKHYNYTVTQLIRQKKMNKAQCMLNMGFTICKTSEECGYDDLSYFNRVFKKYYGLSPRDFKNRHLQK